MKPLHDHDVLIKVFHGPKDKFTGAFTNMAIEFGKEKIELINVAGEGKNALDFIIAYYIGKYTKDYESPSFYIISKDKDYTALVKYLVQVEKRSCFLVPSISEISILNPDSSSVIKPIVRKANTEKSIDDWYKVVSDKLLNPKVPKPKLKKTLRNQIVNYCHKTITYEIAEQIIQKLIENKVIEYQNESVKFN